MTNDRLDALERLAKAAFDRSEMDAALAATAPGWEKNSAAYNDAVHVYHSRRLAFRAALNPAVALELIAEIKALKAEAAGGNDKLAGYEAPEERSETLIPASPSNGGRAEDLTDLERNMIDRLPFDLAMKVYRAFVSAQALRSNSPEAG